MHTQSSKTFETFKRINYISLLSNIHIHAHFNIDLSTPNVHINAYSKLGLYSSGVALEVYDFNFVE